MIFTRQSLIDELISFGFCDRAVRSLVNETLNESLSPNEKRLGWLIFGLSPNLGLSESLSDRLIQKVN